MAWELIGDLESYTATVGDFLRSEPVRNTTLLSLVDSLRRRGLQTYGVDPPVFGAWHDPYGKVAGALLQTPPFPMYFSGLPPEAVAAALLDGRSLPGVNLLAGAVDSFVEPWRARTGVTALAAEEARRAGADEIVLFPDLGNPTSNALYQRLGFRPIEDRTVVAFA